jgi:hypothetical protein
MMLSNAIRGHLAVVISATTEKVDVLVLSSMRSDGVTISRCDDLKMIGWPARRMRRHTSDVVGRSITRPARA